jgi:hypothetical protein
MLKAVLAIGLRRAWLASAGLLLLVAACQQAGAGNPSVAQQTGLEVATNSISPDAAIEVFEAVLPDLRAAYQARVTPGGLRDQLALCDDVNGRGCAAGRYLVSGDILLVRKEAGGFLLVSFVNSIGAASEGWVRRDRTERLSPEYGIDSGWEGEWRSDALRDPHIISINKAAGWREYDVKGDATFGQNDPWRVKRGGVNIGEFAGRIVVQDNSAALAEGEDDNFAFDCKVKFRKLGLFLIVADNRRCGGHQVRFDGVYRTVARLGR